jgi:hypothetical protein
MSALYMARTCKTDEDLQNLINTLAVHYESNEYVRVVLIPADDAYHAIGRIKIRGRMFALISRETAFTFTEIRSADQDITINNIEELVHTIDTIIAGWQPEPLK